jgi:hypothetical protein
MRVTELLSEHQLQNYESLKHNLAAKFMTDRGPWVQLQNNLVNEPLYVINCIY